MTAWSYSRFAKYEQCPLAFKLKYINKTPEPQGPAMERGDLIHKGIAAYLRGDAPAPPPDAVKHPFVAAFIAQLHGFDDKVIEQQWGYTKTWAPTGWFGKDTWFRNVQDAAVLYDDMTLDGPDWKTGKRYGSNADQMEVNAIALFAHFKPAKHVTTRMVYVDTLPGDNAEDVADFDREKDFENLKAKWERKVAPMFNDTVFAPRPNDKCKFCHFSRSNTGLCRFG